jgi:hypothetical protein
MRAAGYARLIMCLFGWDLMSMWVVVCVRGFTIAAPRMGLQVLGDPSVYMKALGSHAATKWRTGYRPVLEVFRGSFGYGSVYEWLLSIRYGSFC